MKKILLAILICMSAISFSQIIQRQVVDTPEKLQAAFVTTTNSEYDPMDIFGILTFLTQKNSSGKYNYEIMGISWDHIAKAIKGEHKYVAHLKNPNGVSAITWIEKKII